MNINERIERVLALDLGFIPNRGFSHLRKLGEMPTAIVRRTKAPAGLSAYLAALYDTPLLSFAQEQYLFRAYNWLKYKAARSRLRMGRNVVLISQVERLHKQAVAVRQQIIKANLRLVVAMAKRYEGDINHYISDGNISLLKAVEKFDYARGFKFSTYATWAIRKNFARSVPAEQAHQTRFSPRDSFEECSEYRGSEYAEERRQAVYKTQVAQLLGVLNDRERDVIVGRFGIDCEPQTLLAVGGTLGICKERVRQLERDGLSKLGLAARRSGMILEVA